MKKLILSAAILMGTAIRVSAQSKVFGNFASQLQSEVETLFPIILSIVFIICALFNMGNFFGENRDIKKGITNIILYVGGTFLIIGVYTYLTSISL